MSEASANAGEASAWAAEETPTEDELREFGRGWVAYLDLDPDEVITHRRSDGKTLTFPLGDVAIVSPHSIGAFNALGELIAAHGPEHPEVAAQTATIMGYVNYYRGAQTQTPSVAG